MTAPSQLRRPADTLDWNDPVYPSSDGKPMAENTLQFQWIVTIKENLELLFLDRQDVFVAGDLFWYPVQGKPGFVAAPDAMVVFGRLKHHRPSYKQWLEDGIAPQVVFEVLSPGNTDLEMDEKRAFYERYGVEEYYVYDPDHVVFDGWVRRDAGFQRLVSADDWRSPLLGVRFVVEGGELHIYRPDGQPFRAFPEMEHLRLDALRQAGEAKKRAGKARKRAEAAGLQVGEARQEAEEARRLAEEARQQVGGARREAEDARRQAEEADRRADEADQRAEEAQRTIDLARTRAERLAERLRALGLDPEG